MTDLDDALKIEEKEWREMPYPEIESIIGDVKCYIKNHNGKSFQFEIHTKTGKAQNEIIVMVECSKNSFFGSFFGKTRYFAKSINGNIREIEGDEPF